MKKSWREKLANDQGLPKVGKVTGNMTKRWGTGTMVIPAPREVEALMRQVPKGRVVTINELRAALAKKHQADFAGPITTGIFSWIAAHAAAEAEAEGARRITPYWRTLKTGGEVNPKYPGGVDALAKRLRAEGHEVVGKGQRALVADTKGNCLANSARMKTGQSFPLTLDLVAANVSPPHLNPGEEVRAGSRRLLRPRGEGRGEGEPKH
jgi:alkylated DNA nucleotide flippase Atl1